MEARNTTVTEMQDQPLQDTERESTSKNVESGDSDKNIENTDSNETVEQDVDERDWNPTSKPQ